MVWLAYAPFGASPPLFVRWCREASFVTNNPGANRIAGMMKRVIAGACPGDLDSRGTVLPIESR